jgi:hypothetical protein
MSSQLPFDDQDPGQQSAWDVAEPSPDASAERPGSAEASAPLPLDRDVNQESAQSLDEQKATSVGRGQATSQAVTVASRNAGNPHTCHDLEKIGDETPARHLDADGVTPSDDSCEVPSGTAGTTETHEHTNVSSMHSPPTRVHGVLTNRWNLIEFLSRRMIVPSDAITKYYEDLLHHVPGRVPIVSAPVSDELLSAVSGDDAVVFPVFLELTAGWEPGTTTAIPLADITAIHFRTGRDLEEHRARKFSNVGDSPPLKVTPDLFRGGDQTLAHIAERPPKTRKRQATALRWASSWSGAVVVGLTGVDTDANADASAALARLLDGRPWGRLKAAAHLGALTSLRSGRPPRAGKDLESRLFSYIAERFATDGLPGDALGFVRALPEHIEIDDRTAAAFKKICDILDGEIEFRPFRRTGSPVAKGLLIALLRGKPERLQPWATEVAHADPVSTLTAGVLLGLAAGRHTLPEDMRVPPLDLALANVELAAMTGASMTGMSEVEAEHSDAGGGVRYTIRVEGFPDIYLDERAPVSLNDLLAEASPLTDEVEALCVRLAVEQGWFKALSIRSERLMTALGAGDPASPAAKALRTLLEEN